MPALMPFFAKWLIGVGLAYLIGSIPFGLLIGLARGIDVRAQGSGNIGATNVRRVVGKAWGNLAFACDVLKGAGPVVVFGLWLGLLERRIPLSNANAFAFMAIGVAAILGHMFPIYLRFKGGKGVATGLGALGALWPQVTLGVLLALATWITVVRATRYVSVASCAAALALPLGILILTLIGWPNGAAPIPTRLALAWPYLAVTGALGALVVWKHRGNLARVRAGTEPKIGTTSRTAPGSLDSEKSAQ